MLALRQAKPQNITRISLHHLNQLRTFIDTPIKHVRDKGLDHAVIHLNHLKPLLNLKNLIKSQPSKTLPLSTLNSHRYSLRIPFRPIDFTRLYPSIFTHHSLPNSPTEPLIGLTPQAVDLDAEEIALFGSDSYMRKIADRLVKLVMIGKVNRIPLRLVDRLKWDLGLPEDYVESVVPQFPDYFRVSKGELELVCWVDELAKSVVEAKGGEFGVVFSSGFEVDKKYKKWLEEWKKLPYFSPYEFNGVKLAPRSDESDKWVTGILHEVLSCFVTKRTERDNLFSVGDWLGVRARVKRALIHHPGIFYTSSKLGTYTVVLKEGFKRGMLVESDELMSLRSKYVHLMHTVKEETKRISAVEEGKSDRKEGACVADSGAEDEADEIEEDDDDDDDTESEEEDEEERKDARGRNRVRSTRRTNVNANGTEKRKDTRDHNRVRSSTRRTNVNANGAEERKDTRDHNRVRSSSRRTNVNANGAEERKDTRDHNRVRSSTRRTNLDAKGASKGYVRDRPGNKLKDKVHPRGGRNLKTEYNA